MFRGVVVAVMSGCFCLDVWAGPDHLLWDPSVAIPRSTEIPSLVNARFTMIKRREPEKDGYNWLHGVAIVRHKNTFYSCWGHNKGAENTLTEVVQGSRSYDEGRTWSGVEMIAAGDDKTAESHGVFLSHKGTLWLFVSNFTGWRRGTKTKAYVLSERGNEWESRGIVAENDFWPMAEPRRMNDGNWIMPGIIVSGTYPAGVAISHGEDFTRWDVISIPQFEKIGRMWGESAVIVAENEITNIARYGAKAVALVSTSRDFGRTWTPMCESNLPMSPSKPYAGILSTGQRYVIGTIVADAGFKRVPLTIAVSRPGERLLRGIFCITDRTLRDNPSGAQPHLAYPYAVERDKKLYVVYSAALQSGNLNDAELAVFNVDDLKLR